jgi:hypothetical protein
MPVTINGTNGVTFNNGGVQASPAVGSSSQTLTNVTSSRALFTTYTNSTNAPIVVYAWCSSLINGGLTVLINSINVDSSFNNNSGTNSIGVSFIVPIGATYSVTNVINAVTLSTWYELR